MFQNPQSKPTRQLARFLFMLGISASFCAGQTLYDFGNPKAEEQLYLEFINRARANPPAEGARLAATTDTEVRSAYTYFGVNLSLMQSEFNAISATPPLAPNSKLTGIARNHSAWMLANAIQTHDQTNPSNTPFTRMTSAGYSYGAAGENVYAAAKSVWHGHAGFQSDWGTAPDGMQTGRGHRLAIHKSTFREIGVGVVLGNNGASIGPQLVTQDFGTQSSSPPTLGTGVAYYDLNSNDFYDIGEGIAGLTVNVNGASYYCTTAEGGGWTVPVPTAAATRSVTFSGLNVNQSMNLTFPASTNAKADLKLAYTPPSITSPATASVNNPHNIAFNAVGGATSYKWNRWTTSAAAAENCENTTNITSSTTGSYSVTCSTASQGTASFHLATPTPVSQSIELKPLYFGNTSPSITFQSCLGYATSTEYAKVQVKEEGGAWTDVYSQAGSGGSGERVFTQRSATLTGMSGKAFRVRFLFSYNGGSYYNQTDYDVGWLIDAINFTNVSTLSNNSLTTLATNSGSFTPTATGTFLMGVTPVISGRDFPSTYQNLTVSTAASQTVTLAASPASVMENSGSGMSFTFTRAGVTTAALTANFSVSGTTTHTGDYTTSGAASFTASTGTVTFPAGVTTANVIVTPVGDTTVEPDETIALAVTTGTGYTAGSPSSATGTITNDDTTVAVAVSPASVTEDGVTNLIYTFTRTGVTTAALTANFSVSGNATLTTDYTTSGAASFTASTGTVTFPAGATTATVTVDPAADISVEPDETITLTITAATGYSVGSPSTATGTITNDDIPTVTIAVSPASVTEDGTTNLVYTFTRTGATTAALTANFSVSGTATLTSDYTTSGAASFTASTGTVTFPAGATTATITVDPAADISVEADETIALTITTSTGYTAGSPSSATGTITNDDTTVAVAVSPASVTEDGATNLIYTFTRAGVTTAALTANFSVSGNATLTTDYTTSGAASFTASTGTVTFAAGATTATITVDPAADTTVELDETITLTVTTGTGYTAGSPSSATVTITNDDTSVSVAVSPAIVDEDGTAKLIYTFTRTGPTSSAITVNFSVGGTASRSNDYSQSGAATYNNSSGTVTISAGNATATVTLDPGNDTSAEPSETAILTVTSGAGYSIGSPSVATGTINNDDTQVSVKASTANVIEDAPQTLSYTFTRTNTAAGAITVNFTVSGTGTLNTDYTTVDAPSFSASSGSVTFADNALNATVTLDPIADTAVEPDETITLAVTNGTGYKVGATPIDTGVITNDDTSTTYATWAAAIETSKELPAGTLATKPNDDYDRDGRSNLIEFAFGADPVVPNDPAPRMPKLVPSPTHLVLQYQVDTSLENLNVTPQVSTSLATWFPSEFSVTNTTGTVQTHEVKVPRSPGNKAFLRVKVDSP